MRSMFPTVEALVRLLFVNGASSASGERSFRSLRRLKTYIRLTCGQLRMNSIAICHIHKHIIDEVNIRNALREIAEYRDNCSLYLAIWSGILSNFWLGILTSYYQIY